MRVPGEPDSPFGPAAHDSRQRASSLRASGLDGALLCTSTPLGVEALPEDEARPLLDAWHEGVREAGEPFGVWGALPLDGATPGDVDRLLGRGAVGVSFPAPALRGPHALERVGPLLERLEQRGTPLLVHPGPAGPPVADAEEVADAWWPALTGYVADVNVAWHAFLAWGRPRHPRLRVCFAMLAGLAPLHAERLGVRGGPADRVQDPGLFYDTSSYGPRAIGAMAAVVGAEQLVFGSDRPVVDGLTAAALGEETFTALARDNVRRLLHGPGAVR
jgi:hypothetical protein